MTNPAAITTGTAIAAVAAAEVIRAITVDLATISRAIHATNPKGAKKATAANRPVSKAARVATKVAAEAVDAVVVAADVVAIATTAAVLPPKVSKVAERSNRPRD
jgi:hypothetical protein